MRFRRGSEYESLTYRQLKAKVLRVVNYLVHVGLQPEDRTVTCTKARPEWIWSDMGVLMAGGVNTAIPEQASKEDFVHIVNDLGAKFIFVEKEEQLEILKAAKAEMPSLELIFYYGELQQAPEFVVPFSWLFEFSTKAEGMGVLYKMEETKSKDSLLTVVYPTHNLQQHGIQHTHGACLETIQSMSEYFGANLNGVVKNLSFLCPSHPFARFLDYYLILMTGRCICFAESDATIIKNIKDIKPQVLFAEPTFIDQLYETKEKEIGDSSFFRKRILKWAVRKGSQASEYTLHNQPVPGLLKIGHKFANMLVYKKIKKEFGGNLRFLVSGGQALKPEVVQFFHALGVTVLDSFGAPQTAFAATVNLPSQMRFGSAGRPLPNVSVRVSDYNEIEIKGTGLFSSYYNSPHATKEAFTQDGFFKTGKVGRIDEQGFLYVTGNVIA